MAKMIWSKAKSTVSNYGVVVHGGRGAGRSAIIEATENTKKQKMDYSGTCNLNDEDQNNKCWQCSRFCFPIGCMVYHDGRGRAAK